MSTARKRGTAFESEVVKVLRRTWPTAERRALSGARDRGDVAGVPRWTIEVKAAQAIDLAGAVDEALTEAANADTPYAVAIIKRRNRRAEDAYAVMPLEMWAEVAQAAQP